MPEICPTSELDDLKIVCRLCGEAVEADDSFVEQDRHERCERVTVVSVGAYRREPYEARSKARLEIELERSKLAAYNVEFKGATVRCSVCRQNVTFLSGSIYAGDETYSKDMALDYVHPECNDRRERNERPALARRLSSHSAMERRQEEIDSRYDAWEAILRSRFGDEWYENKIGNKVESLRARCSDDLGTLHIVAANCEG